MQSWEEMGTTDPEEPREHHWVRPIRVSLSDDHGCQSHSLDSWGYGYVPGQNCLFLNLLTEGTQKGL